MQVSKSQNLTQTIVMEPAPVDRKSVRPMEKLETVWVAYQTYVQLFTTCRDWQRFVLARSFCEGRLCAYKPSALQMWLAFLSSLVCAF